MYTFEPKLKQVSDVGLVAIAEGSPVAALFIFNIASHVMYVRIK